MDLAKLKNPIVREFVKFVIENTGKDYKQYSQYFSGHFILDNAIFFRVNDDPNIGGVNGYTKNAIFTNCIFTNNVNVNCDLLILIDCKIQASLNTTGDLLVITNKTIENVSSEGDMVIMSNGYSRINAGALLWFLSLSPNLNISNISAPNGKIRYHGFNSVNVGENVGNGNVEFIGCKEVNVV
jgi:hypothetical protein